MIFTFYSAWPVERVQSFQKVTVQNRTDKLALSNRRYHKHDAIKCRIVIIIRHYTTLYAILFPWQIHASRTRFRRRYPISIDGQQRASRPHDLRRGYARNLFKAGISTEVIRQNLGHADVKTTQAYIGVLDGADRAPVSVYEPTEILARMQAAML